MWNGITVNPQDQIQIIGKVDKEWNNTEIDVKQVIKNNDKTNRTLQSAVNNKAIFTQGEKMKI
ncbi:Uncharacterized conserved protein [Rodentibacter pneumotropicus]|uniref:Uncharacterized conserved protein n=1 Tax=Rodentibacter pneumotropicus TaxID=758 RepID=A0A448MTR6_9PAST|nr:Uncharacterized conserved protein [Rodentibacter pneumotropicus]